MTIRADQIDNTPRVLSESASKPTTGADEGSFYLKDVSGVTEAFYVDDQGREIQITNDGSPIGGGSSAFEYGFTLGAGANMAARIAAVSGLPAGWSLTTADAAGIQEYGALATTLIITHSLTKTAIEIGVYEINPTGFSTNKGIAKIDLTSPGVQKSAIDKNSCGVLDLQSLTDDSLDLFIFVKLL
jgi:hypothetical protein